MAIAAVCFIHPPPWNASRSSSTPARRIGRLQTSRMAYCIGSLSRFARARPRMHVRPLSVMHAVPFSSPLLSGRDLLRRKRFAGLRCYHLQPRHHTGGWAAEQQSSVATTWGAAAQLPLLSAQLRGLRFLSASQSHSRSVTTAAATSSSHAASSEADGSQEASAVPESAVGSKGDQWRLTEDMLEFWNTWLDRVNERAATELLEDLDRNWQFGIPPGMTVYNDKPIDSLKTFRQAKAQDRHPLAVALVQFDKPAPHYKALGTDAVLLLQHLGHLAGAGLAVKFPEAELQGVIQQLVKAGLSVALWQTTPGNDKDMIDTKPPRYCTLVTPESPFMTDSDTEGSGDWDLRLPDVYGISLTSTQGCSVYVLDQATRTVSVYEGLSDDCVWGVIAAAADGLGAVHLHRRLDMPKKPRSGPDAPDLERRYVLLRQALRSRAAVVREYDGVDALEAFKQEVRQVTNIGQDEEITHRSARAADGSEGLLPLYLSSIQQLGLISHPGIPSLADHLLPKKKPEDSSTLVRQLLVRLLMNPPPHAVASALRQGLWMLKRENIGFEFQAERTFNPDKVALLLRNRKDSEKLFWSLQGALERVMATALDPTSDVIPADGRVAEPEMAPTLQRLTQTVWPALCHIMGCDMEQLTQQNVFQATRQALQEIQSTVVGMGNDSQQPSGSKGDVAEPLQDLAQSKERFVNRVKLVKIEDKTQQVTLAFERLANTAATLLAAVAAEVQRRRSKKVAGSDLPCLYFDKSNSAVWLKVPSKQRRQFTVCLGEAGQQQLKDPEADFGYADVKGQKQLYTCEALENCLTEYRDAVDEANQAATKALRELSGKLLPSLRELTSAVQLGILLQLLYDHSVTAEVAGWSLPAVGREEQLAAGESEESVGKHGALRLEGVFPYWMEGNKPDTIKNTITLPEMMMLTGPNMAGKSTVLRMVAAACLCACIGLNIPAQSSSAVPHLDAVMLRTFSGDAPIEGLSAYAVEMHEMSYVLADASERSLVLIDELGKGTEVMWGTAIASALLHKLINKRASGIFATHLHGLLELFKEVQGIQQHSMEVQQRNTGRLAPTRKVVPGVCTRSLALDVARERGLPERVLQRAQEHYDRLVAWSKAEEPLDTSAAPLVTAVTTASTSSAPAQAAAGSADGTTSSSGSSQVEAGSETQTSGFQQRAEAQQRLVQLMLARLVQGQGASLRVCLGDKPGNASLEELAFAVGQVDLSQVYHLFPGRLPCPLHHKKSVVYAARYPTNIWHVGESEDIRQRWAQHAGKSHRRKKVLPHTDLWYVVLKPELANERWLLQAELIFGLDVAGIPQDSKHDAHYLRR